MSGPDAHHPFKLIPAFSYPLLGSPLPEYTAESGGEMVVFWRSGLSHILPEVKKED